MNNPQIIGQVAALSTAFCWTVTSLSFEAAGRRIGSLQVNLIRLVAAFGLFTLYGTAVHGRLVPFDAGAHVWIWLSLSGLVGFVLGDLFLFQAFVDVGARTAMLIYSSVPPMTAVLGWLILGERLTPVQVVAMALTVAGIVTVTTARPSRTESTPHTDASANPEKRPRSSVVPLAEGGELPGTATEHARSTPKTDAVVAAHPAGTVPPNVAAPVSAHPLHPHRLRGMWFAVLGAAGQAAGLVLSRYGAPTYDPFGATQIRTLAGIVGFSVLFLVLRRWKHVIVALRDMSAMRHVARGSFFGPFLGVSLGLYAAQRAGTGVASTIIATVPVLLIPVSIVFLHERVTLRETVGAVVAVTGVALLFLA